MFPKISYVKTADYLDCQVPSSFQKSLPDTSYTVQVTQITNLLYFNSKVILCRSRIQAAVFGGESVRLVGIGRAIGRADKNSRMIAG